MRQLPLHFILYRKLSTGRNVTYANGIFYIYNEKSEPLIFDPELYYDASDNHLIYLSNDSQQCLLHFPQTGRNANYILFYILDTTEIQEFLSHYISNEIPAIALIDSDRQIAVDINGLLLRPFLDSYEDWNGIHSLDQSNSLYVQTDITNGFSLVALISNDFLFQQINAAFACSYLFLLVLSILTFLLILMAMKSTYIPLHKLVQKILPDSPSNQGYIQLLDKAFSEAKEEKQLLQSKLNKYRFSMQKMLLDATITSHNPGDEEKLPNIDQFFDGDSGNEIFVLRMEAQGKHLPYNNILKYFLEVLPGKDSCYILESGLSNAVFLLNYTGNEQNKREILKSLLNNYYEEEGYLSAISNSSNSPLDIPSLYENAIAASSHWPQNPVADYSLLPPISIALAYPHEKLDHLSAAFYANDFTEAQQLIGELFQVIDRSASFSNDIPDFFRKCVMVDMLTIVISSMNQSGIKFKDYSDLYFETLYFCQNCPYSEKKESIIKNTKKLLSFYEQETLNKIVNPAQIKSIIEESYCQPDFSIAILADKFEVSIAYMSYFIKKELDQNFSNYLWTLRLKKAKELLQNSDMTIDEISIAVGYLNTSSFRRKFKQEIGITPSQYRAQIVE